MTSPLLSHDRTSAVWIKLERFLQERLAEHRAKLEGDLSEHETTRLRARIAECKFFLALGEPPTPDQVADD